MHSAIAAYDAEVETIGDNGAIPLGLVRSTTTAAALDPRQTCRARV